MSEDKAKDMAYKLTVEYMRKNIKYLSDVESRIPEMVDDFARLHQKFYNEIINNDILNKLY